MKTFIIFFSLFFIQNGFAQLGTDTLHFGNKKYPLQKVKKSYSVFQPNIPYVPIEYKEHQHELRVTHTSKYDSSYTFEDGDNGESFMVMKPASKNSVEYLSLYLGSFLDTIRIKSEELYNLKIYITSKGKRIPFSAFRMVNSKNGVGAEFTAGYIASGDLFRLFDFFNEGYRKQQFKNSTFFITDLYYRRGDAIYFFDRDFIILCE